MRQIKLPKQIAQKAKQKTSQNGLKKELVAKEMLNHLRSLVKTAVTGVFGTVGLIFASYFSFTITIAAAVFILIIMAPTLATSLSEYNRINKKYDIETPPFYINLFNRHKNDNTK